GGSIDGAAPVVHDHGKYQLNVDAGVGVDVMCFDATVEAGEQNIRVGRRGAATVLFRRALAWYKGDLCGGEDTQAVIERERLRAQYLTILARLADDCYENAN